MRTTQIPLFGTLVVTALVMTPVRNLAQPPTEAKPDTKTATTVDRTGGWVGKTASGFTLPDAEGKTVDVGAILGKKPVVLVFYRGVW
jgi:hypothetical protein